MITPMVRDMRLIVYVPTSPRAREAARRAAQDQGHEVVGYALSPAEAQAAINSGTAEKIGVTKLEHAAGLVPWILPIPPRRRGLLLIAAALVAAAWSTPRGRIATGATTVAAASVLAMPTPTAMPPLVPPAQPPAQLLQTTVVEAPPPVQLPVVVTPRPATPKPTPTPPTPPTTATAPTPTPTCQLVNVGVDVLGLPIRACIGRPSG